MSSLVFFITKNGIESRFEKRVVSVLFHGYRNISSTGLGIQRTKDMCDFIYTDYILVNLLFNFCIEIL